jgi:hypothetical protein
MTVIVQQIVTEWSKASRGGDRPGRRNAVPIAAKLPPISENVDVAVHSLRYGEVQSEATPVVDFVSTKVDCCSR